MEQKYQSYKLSNLYMTNLTEQKRLTFHVHHHHADQCYFHLVPFFLTGKQPMKINYKQGARQAASFLCCQTWRFEGSERASAKLCSPISAAKGLHFGHSCARVHTHTHTHRANNVEWHFSFSRSQQYLSNIVSGFFSLLVTNNYHITVLFCNGNAKIYIYINRMIHAFHFNHPLHYQVLRHTCTLPHTLSISQIFTHKCLPSFSSHMKSHGTLTPIKTPQIWHAPAGF